MAVPIVLSRALVNLLTDSTRKPTTVSECGIRNTRYASLVSIQPDTRSDELHEASNTRGHIILNSTNKLLDQVSAGLVIAVPCPGRIGGNPKWNSSLLTPRDTVGIHRAPQVLTYSDEEAVSCPLSPKTSITLLVLV